MSIIPNFFIIGASKCGSTSLYNMLAAQDGCCMSSVKEPAFFNNKNKELDWYLSLFDHCFGNVAIGEASPVYSETTYFPWIPEKIYNFNPSAKLIYIVRHPYDRLKSVWKQTLSTGHFYKKKHYHKTMPLCFEKAIFDHPPFLEACKYWTHIQNYRSFFDDTKIKVIYFDDYIQNISQTMQRLNVFLGLPNFIEPPLDARGKNTSKGKVVSNPLLQWINDVPILQQIKENIPGDTKKFIKRITHLPVPSNPQISNEVKEKIRAELKDEVLSLFEYTGKSPDFWKM
jgi:hypothetical protein